MPRIPIFLTTVQWSPIKHRLNFTFDAWFVWSDSIVTNFKIFFSCSLWQESFKRGITSLYSVRQKKLWLDKVASKTFTSNWRQLSALVEISYNYLSCEFTAHDACNNAEMNLKSTGAFLSTQNSGLVYQMERTISVWSNQNIPDQLWRLSTLTGQVISAGRTEMSLSIWQNCCPQYCSFVSCLQE